MDTDKRSLARIDRDEFTAIAPGVVSHLRRVGAAVEESGLDKQLIELVKIRISQINGCAFCVQYHLDIARGLDVPAAKLDQLTVWPDTPIYSARERAALAWGEALTKMAQQHVGDAIYTELGEHFTREEVANLTGAIGAINAWNRIAGGLRYTPPSA
ncbi:MAG: carboxymuconolactone decarboxylase family protein [Gammaproteobacteria bacterium]